MPLKLQYSYASVFKNYPKPDFQTTKYFSFFLNSSPFSLVKQISQGKLPIMYFWVNTGVSCYIRCQWLNWRHLCQNMLSLPDVGKAKTSEVIFSVLETFTYQSTKSYWGLKSIILLSQRVWNPGIGQTTCKKKQLENCLASSDLTALWEVGKLQLSLVPWHRERVGWRVGCLRL